MKTKTQEKYENGIMCERSCPCCANGLIALQEQAEELKGEFYRLSQESKIIQDTTHKEELQAQKQKFEEVLKDLYIFSMEKLLEALNNSGNHNQPLSIGKINADVSKCSERSVGKKDKTPKPSLKGLSFVNKEDRGSNLRKKPWDDVKRINLILNSDRGFGKKFQPKDEVKE